jgi:hypothetical protein
MQGGEKSPEGGLWGQLSYLQNPGQHRVVRDKTQMIQSRETHVQSQYHPQQELIDGHRSRQAIDAHGLFHQLFEPQLLQHRGYR